jgi:hypothetical protein
MAASLESTTTGRRPISAGSHHQITVCRLRRLTTNRRQPKRCQVAPLVGFIDGHLVMGVVSGVDLGGTVTCDE